MPRQPKKVVTITQVKDQPCDNQRQAMSQLRRIKWGIEFRNEKVITDILEKNKIDILINCSGLNNVEKC